MQKIINHMVQLQELCIARAQQEAAMPGAQLTQLNESIETMLGELPRPEATMFQKLQTKGPMSIVPISTTVCTACGMSLPASLVQAVKQADSIQQCPSCARMLYYTSAAPKSKPRKTSRFEAPKVGIERFSSPDLMVLKMKSKDREETIAELCERMEESDFVESKDTLIEEALKREAIVSTAVDNGLAFPHVRGVEGGGLTLALGTSKKGIKFGNPSGKLTRIIFFMVIPTAASAFYLKLLSGLTQSFSKKETREKLLEAETPKDAWKVLVKATKNKIT